MIQLLHQRQQQTDLAGWKALASEPIEVLSWQVGDQPAFVLAVRHDACNQQLQVFVVHPETGSIDSFVCDKENNLSLAALFFVLYFTIS